MNNDYYVYIYWRLDINEPFYIGRGRNKRWKEVYDTHRNKHFMNIANKYPIICEIIKSNLTEEQSNGIECWLINELVFEYGFSIDIKNNRSVEKKYNHLVNQTWGGEGTSGRVLSEASKQKISDKNKGRKLTEVQKENIRKRMKGENNPNYGKPRAEKTKEKISKSEIGKKHTEESKRKISKAKKGKYTGKDNVNSKCVICLTTKKIFYSTAEAGVYYNTSRGNISSCCNKKRKYAGKLLNGTPLIWRYINWEHDKKYRVKK